VSLSVAVENSIMIFTLFCNSYKAAETCGINILAQVVLFCHVFVFVGSSCFIRHSVLHATTSQS
jgi:hypothetical protein